MSSGIVIVKNRRPDPLRQCWRLREAPGRSSESGQRQMAGAVFQASATPVAQAPTVDQPVECRSMSPRSGTWPSPPRSDRRTGSDDERLRRSGAHCRSAAPYGARGPRVAVCMMRASPRPRPSSTGTVIAANATVWTNAARKRGSPAASMKLSKPMNGRPSHGSRRSCPCSASQAVAAIGNSEPTRMKASAGATRIGTSQRSPRASVGAPWPERSRGPRLTAGHLRQPVPNAQEGHACRRRRGEAPPPVWPARSGLDAARLAGFPTAPCIRRHRPRDRVSMALRTCSTGFRRRRARVVIRDRRAEVARPGGPARAFAGRGGRASARRGPDGGSAADRQLAPPSAAVIARSPAEMARRQIDSPPPTAPDPRAPRCGRLRMNSLPFWNANRVCSSCHEHRRGHEPAGAERVAHERSAPDHDGLVDDDLPACVDDAAAEAVRCSRNAVTSPS